jgi:flagellar hook-basal body complex protein FliE
MNPLAAIRQWAAPDLASLPLKSSQDAASSGAIPVGDFKSLGMVNPADQVGQSAPSSNSFGQLLGQMVQDVSEKKAVADDAAQAVLSGQNVPLHQAVIAMQESSVSFQLMVEVRNKLLESYQEIMRMQV